MNLLKEKYQMLPELGSRRVTSSYRLELMNENQNTIDMKYLEIEIKKFYFNMKHYGLQFIIKHLFTVF